MSLNICLHLIKMFQNPKNNVFDVHIYFIYIFFIHQVNEYLSYLCEFFWGNLTHTRGRTEISAIISAQRRVWSPSYDHSAHTQVKLK